MTEPVAKTFKGEMVPTGQPDMDGPPPGSWAALRSRFGRSRMGVLGMRVLVVFYVVALLAPFAAPYDAAYQNIHRVSAPPQMPHIWDSGGLHWPFIYDLKIEDAYGGLQRRHVPDTSRRVPVAFFVKGQPYKVLGMIPLNLRLFGARGCDWNVLGTDSRGGDLFSRLVYGARVSLTVGLVGVMLSLFLGTVIGTISGYFGGTVDFAVQRAVELLMVFPAIPLWMALAAALPARWNPLAVYFGIVSILSLVGWGALARQVRGMVLAAREQDFVKAAQCFGASHAYVVFRHLIPSCTGHLIVTATLAVPGMILGETALSFLGLGIRPPMTSWGVLLQDAQHLRVMADRPWLLLPAVPVLIVVVAFNFVGDALRDALDPDL